MTVKEIKIILLQKDLTVAGLAREFGCFKEQLHMCIHRRRPYPKLRKKLAKRLGMEVEELFAEKKTEAEAQ